METITGIVNFDSSNLDPKFKEAVNRTSEAMAEVWGEACVKLYKSGVHETPSFLCSCIVSTLTGIMILLSMTERQQVAIWSALLVFCQQKLASMDAQLVGKIDIEGGQN